MPRIPQNLRERVIGMLNACITMNAFAANIYVLLVLFDTLGNVFKQQGAREDRPRDGRLRVTTRVRNAIFGTPTCAIASKLPQLLLLIPMMHITIVYLPKLCAITCARVG